VSDYSRLIKRVAFLSPDRDRRFTCLLLEHLRDVRNGLVHAGEVRSSIEAYLGQVKNVAELLLRYHFIRGSSYPSIAKAAEYLDTPADPEILKQRIRDYRRVLRLRT